MLFNQPHCLGLPDTEAHWEVMEELGRFYWLVYSLVYEAMCRDVLLLEAIMSADSGVGVVLVRCISRMAASFSSCSRL